MKPNPQSSLARRSFMARLGAAAAAAGGTVAAGTTSALAQTTSARTPAEGRWQPARHPQDDWLDRMPGTHRIFFDTTTPDRLADAILFVSNAYKEITANLIDNGRLVPAGIVALNRAHERGYTIT